MIPRVLTFFRAESPKGHKFLRVQMILRILWILRVSRALRVLGDP